MLCMHGHRRKCPFAWFTFFRNRCIGLAPASRNSFFLPIQQPSSCLMRLNVANTALQALGNRKHFSRKWNSRRHKMVSMSEKELNIHWFSSMWSNFNALYSIECSIFEFMGRLYSVSEPRERKTQTNKTGNSNNQSNGHRSIHLQETGRKHFQNFLRLWTNTHKFQYSKTGLNKIEFIYIACMLLHWTSDKKEREQTKIKWPEVYKQHSTEYCSLLFA